MSGALNDKLTSSQSAMASRRHGLDWPHALVELATVVIGRIVWLSHLCCCWINNLLDFRDAVCREAASMSVRSNHCFVLGNIDAVDLVPSDVAVQPLNLRAELS